MASNEFLPFCPSDIGTNLMTQSDYSLATQRSIGNQPGIASSKLVNKATRQAAWVAAQLAQYMSNVTGQSVLDDGNSANFLSTLSAALTSGFNYQAKTANYSAAVKDFVSCSGASFNVTLPDATVAASKGLPIVIRHNGTSLTQKYTLLTTGGQTILGPGGTIASGGYILCTAGETVALIPNGTGWEVSGRITATPQTSLGTIKVSSSSGYVFTISSATIVAGDVYSNSGNFFTIGTGGTGTSASCFGTGSPAASGTLTKVTGTGPATLTFSSFSANAYAVGTTTVNDLSMIRNGNICTLIWRLATSGSGTNGLNDTGLLMPTGIAIDLTKVAAFTSGIGTVISVQLASAASIIVGNGQVAVPGSNSYSNSPAYFAPFAGGVMRVAIAQISPTGNYANISSGFYPAGTANMLWNLSCSFPVSDWQP